MPPPDDDLELQRDLSPVGLYSHASEVADRLPQMKGTPQQFAAMLQKQGVKPDELKWSGYDQAFKDQKLITRDQLAQHFKAKMPKVSETVLREGGSDDEVREYHGLSQDQWDRLGSRARANRRSEFIANAAYEPKGDTKYDSHTLPGGKNYREVLLHLPKDTAVRDRKRAIETRMNQIQNHFDMLYGQPDSAALAQQRADLSRENEELYKELSGLHSQDDPNYNSRHWDQPNVLAHLRMSDRKGPKGEKILHLEEMQSDWAQEGRKKGFAEDRAKLLQDVINAEKRSIVAHQTGMPDEEKAKRLAEYQALNAKLDALDAQGKGVPHAPYIDNTQKWLDLGLKRVLHEAAKGGYDKVVVTPGQEQADRYDLSKYIKEIRALRLAGDDKYRLTITGHNGQDVRMPKDYYAAEELPDVVGKEMADKIVKDIDAVYNNRWGVKNKVSGNWSQRFSSREAAHAHQQALPASLRPNTEVMEMTPKYGASYSGLDLKVGGEGMKTFYDKLLPRALEKLAKKHDPRAKIGRMSLGKRGRDVAEIDRDMDANLKELARRTSATEGDDYPRAWAAHPDLHARHERLQRERNKAQNGVAGKIVHSLDITPEMRKSILRGQAAYKEGGKVEGDEEQLHLPFRERSPKLAKAGYKDLPPFSGKLQFVPALDAIFGRHSRDAGKLTRKFTKSTGNEGFVSGDLRGKSNMTLGDRSGVIPPSSFEEWANAAENPFFTVHTHPGGAGHPSGPDLDLRNNMGPRFHHMLIEAMGGPHNRTLVTPPKGLVPGLPGHAAAAMFNQTSPGVSTGLPFRSSDTFGRIKAVNKSMGMRDEEPASLSMLINERLARRYGVPVYMDKRWRPPGAQGTVEEMLPEYLEHLQRHGDLENFKSGGEVETAPGDEAAAQPNPQGGLAFPPQQGAERLRLRAMRIQKGKPVGMPGNPRTVIKAPPAAAGEKQLPDFATGDINFDDWRRRHEQILTPDEIHEASKWYAKINGMFRRYYPHDDAMAHKHRNAWLVAQQNISPPGAMNNVLMQQEQMSRGDPRKIWTAGGMPNPTEAARAVLADQPIQAGVGQKIADFVDSAEGKGVRSWMNNHPHGGAPFVVDVHTARDTGMVDQELVNHLARLGYDPKALAKLKKDLGTSPKGPQYENRADFGRALTKHLNDINWMGRSDWKPHEIQAIGWMGMTKLTRNKEEGAEEGLERNLRRVSFEMAPGEHSPWHKKYGTAFDALPEDQKYGLTQAMTDAAMRHAEQVAGISLHSLVHGTGAWQKFQNPAAVGQMLATQKGADIAANALGYLLNQTEVWHNRVKPPTANPKGFAIDLVEHGGTKHLEDPKRLQELWETIMAADKTGLVQGYQPITTPAGERGIRALVDRGGEKTMEALHKSLSPGGDLDRVLETLPYNIRSQLHEAEITKAKNDWKAFGNGQAYLSRLKQALGRDLRADLDRARASLEEELEAHLDQAHAQAGTSWRQKEVAPPAPRKTKKARAPPNVSGALDLVRSIE